MILHVIDSLNPGGAERVLVELINSLSKNKIPVRVCVTRNGLELAEELNTFVELIHLNRKYTWDLAAIATFANYVRREDIKIIHAHGRHTLKFCALIKLIIGKRLKLVFHDHYGNIHADSSAPIILSILCRIFVDRYIAVDPFLRDWAIQKIKLNPNKTTVLENSIDITRFKKAKTIPSGTLKHIKQPIVGAIVANLRPQKDHTLLFHALANSQKAIDRLHILIIGLTVDQKYRSDCHKTVVKLGLENNITFLGSRMDIPAILKSVEIGLLSSKSESGPVSLLEYMAAERPFLVTRTGRIAKIVEDQGIPYFVPPGDVSEYSRALDELVSLSPRERENLGANEREIVVKLFDLKSKVSQIIDIYSNLLNGDVLKP